MLNPVMTACAGERIRRVIDRSLSAKRVFDHFWQRSRRMEKSHSQECGKAMLKVLPDAINRRAQAVGRPASPIGLKRCDHARAGACGASEPIMQQYVPNPTPRIRSRPS